MNIELHDAELLGIYHKDRLFEVDLFFIDQNMQRKTLFFKGNSYFKCTDFENKNVVFECIVYDDYHENNCNDINYYIKLMVTNSNGEILKNQSEINELTTLIMQKKKKLIVILPSCGAQIIAIADNFILNLVTEDFLFH